MILEEKKNTCSRALVAWIADERQNKDMTIHDDEIKDILTSKMILKKFDMFGIDIVLPDLLLLILAICTNGNPGLFQVMLKDLLNSIKKRTGPIPVGYVITSWDFSLCFMEVMADFPIIEIESVNDKYRKLWDDQKKKDNIQSRETDNLCDTPEWWKEVMEQTPMKQWRCMELLNATIDNLLVAERNKDVIQKLLGIGFTENELITYFSFTEKDVKEASEYME